MTNPSIIRFVNTLIITPDGPRKASVSVHQGRIDAIDSPLSPGGTDIDLHGLWLIPGAIDGHVHFDDPGFTEREDFSSGSKAAAAGGVTTVVDMPCTSLPPVTDGASFDKKLRVVATKACVDYRFWGGVRGNQFDPVAVETSLDELSSRGVRAIKTYLVSGMDTFEDINKEQLQLVMEAAKKRGLLVGVHAEDKQMVQRATANAMRAQDAARPSSYARARSSEAEARAVATCIELAEITGAHVHIVHLACGEGLRLIRKAKQRGVNITSETCPHYLAFTEQDLQKMGGLLKTAPVVKTASDREELWQGVIDGTVDMIATDHAPGVFPREKSTGSIWTDYGGVPGVELLLPYVMSEGVHKGRISPWRALELLCSGPAQIHRLAEKGHIRVGADADLVVFDPNERFIVDPASMWTRQKYTPMQGMTLTGRVKKTFLRGILVYEDGAQGLLTPHGTHVCPSD